MDYFVKRGTEQLGPFSLADLQQQVQSGKISPGDLAKSEGMSDWGLVSQVVGNIAVPVSAASGAAAAPAFAPVATVELPPNLHWGVVLLMGILSRLFSPFILFNMAWTFILANWARKLSGDNNILILVAMYPAGFIAGVFAMVLNAHSDSGPLIGGILIIGGAIAYLIGIFKIKAAMEEYYTSTENMGLHLSGVMTFFFSTVYLQYHVNSIAKWKKTGVP
ncbi:MAG TPA: DUF4339 domain-containing protein [Terriglobales bacterium]|jgi:hypothetical protein|nr:DUF4339 domain-containing protein [Terriglobales bacterium]